MSDESFKRISHLRITGTDRSWIASGCLAVLAAAIVCFSSDSSLEFWWQALPFSLIAALMFAFIFGIPGYLLYCGVANFVFRRTSASSKSRRRWLLGLPLLLLLAALAWRANLARPSVTARRVFPGALPASVRVLGAARGSTMMSDRGIAWFDIAPSDLRQVIQQHAMIETNASYLSHLLNADRVMGGSRVLDRLPQFSNPICYFEAGSDDYMHPYRNVLLTNPNHDRAIWFTSYDR